MLMDVLAVSSALAVPAAVLTLRLSSVLLPMSGWKLASSNEDSK